MELKQNNPFNRKRGITMGLGNRGMAFEKLINLANEMYQRGGVALINKRPTSVKVIKSKGSQVIKGFYEAKSTRTKNCSFFIAHKEFPNIQY
ncbi:Recombination protein U (Penicillin-binding protein-related factor A) [Bacillus cereus ATCC 10876]|nr:Recombination protein U (Penicillin-binding protein-related factor A) [Bacillus cereus ATCC 10876]